MQMIAFVTSIISVVISSLAFVFSIWRYWRSQLRNQANKISAWKSLEKPYLAVINNVSEEPVYNAVLAYAVPNKGYPIIKPGISDFDSAFVPVVPPGTYYVQLSDLGVQGMSAQPEVEIAFADSRGMSWIRDASGLLHGIRPRKPFTFIRGHICRCRLTPQDYMGISLPEDARSIVRIDRC